MSGYVRSLEQYSRAELYEQIAALTVERDALAAQVTDLGRDVIRQAERERELLAASKALGAITAGAAVDRLRAAIAAVEAAKGGSE